jgi:hypothetical protein
MYEIFLILILTSLVTLLLGMVKPDIFKKKNGQTATRKEIATVCWVFIVIFFILAAFTSGSNNQNNSSKTGQTTQPTAETASPIPTQEVTNLDVKISAAYTGLEIINNETILVPRFRTVA